MLTKSVSKGDRVLLVDRNDNRRQRVEPKLLPVEKVGLKYLTISQYGRPKQFPFTGIRDNYELWDSQEAYDRHLQRDRNITKIKKAVSAYSFGDGLSDEDFEQIIKLIEVNQ
jgi:hypothetical protein